VRTNLPLLQTKVKAVRAFLLALALFLAGEVQALDQPCTTVSAEQLAACLQYCPDAEPGVACRRNCIYQQSKAKSACKWPPVHAPGPLVIRNTQGGWR
jgi:hypothetical protein